DIGPDQAVARATVPVATADVRTARMFPNPAIGVNAGRDEPILGGLIAFRLPILGQIGAHVRAAERALDQTRLEMTLALWGPRHDAPIAYYTGARADDELALAPQIQTLTRRVAQIAGERYDAGAGALLEKLQADLIDARAQQDVSDRAAALRVARLELARMVGVGSEGLPPLADSLATVGPMPVLDALVAGAERAHPELRALEAERFAADARGRAARADLRPTFNLELGVELLDPTT